MKDFRSELNRILDEALERGCQPLEIDEVASERLANYTTAKYEKISNILIKCFNVFFCSACAAGIYIYKAYAAFAEHKIPDDNFLNWVSGICLLATAAQFFPVEKMIKLLRGKE